tara:strand:+ start:4450 stop:5262 length:813 start_codon:yes stop_codon:yes gene_type:complete
MKIIFFTYFNLIIIISLLSQDITQNTLKKHEDTLKILSKNIISSESELERIQSNIIFTNKIIRILEYKSAYNYDFGDLETISILQPKDKSFKLFNWILPKEDGTFSYNALIIIPGKKNNTIIELNDQEYNIKNGNKLFYNKDDWYGALYYQIIQIKNKKEKYYTLIGWDGNNQISTIKLIDVLSLNNDSITLGKKIFIKENKKEHRAFIEYSSNSSVSVKYLKKEKTILLDNLTPINPKFKGIYEKYIPEGTYNAYKLIKGKWKYIENFE